MFKNSNKKIFLIALLLVIAVIVLLVVFLLRKDDKVTSGSSNSRIEFTDIVSNTLSFEKHPQRIVMGDHYWELFIVGGEKVADKLVGWTAQTWVRWRNDVYETFAQVVPRLRELPDVGLSFDGSFDVEKVLEIKPDVMIFPKYQFSTLEKGSLQMLRDANIPVAVIDFSLGTIENHTNSIKILGKILDKESRANEVADLYKYYLDYLTERLSNVKSEDRKTVYLEKTSKGPQTYDETWGGTNWAPILERAGGINISKKLFTGLGYADNEFILTENPDFIIFAGSTWPSKKDALQMGFSVDVSTSRANAQKYVDERESWVELKAVKNKDFLLVHHGFIRSIMDFIPTIYFAEKFYPEELSGLNAKKVAKEFFEKYLPVDFKGSWLETLYDK